MKRLLLLILFLDVYIVHAQNYAPLQKGVIHYFTNSDAYLRAIRIDSIIVLGADNIYYPYHTPRGRYNTGIPLDSNGGSWLGRRVIEQPNGDWIFDNFRGDSVIIKSQAKVGDSSTFYNDKGAIHYRADVGARDTMTVAGIIDSVKTIVITAWDSSGIVTADPVNNYKIFLSKNSGFCRVFDLFMFPYHKPDMPPVKGLDYYLDNSGASSFNLLGNINPLITQMNDWDVGDAFEITGCDGSVLREDCIAKTYFRYDSIIAKFTVPGGIKLVSNVWLTTGFEYWGHYDYYHKYIGYNTGRYVDTLFFSNQLFIDTLLLPEEYGNINFMFYYPDDKSCLSTAAFKTVSNEIQGVEVSRFFESSPYVDVYKTGIGKISSSWYLAGSSPNVIDLRQVYTNRRGTICGQFQIHPTPMSVDNIVAATEITISPNPASDHVTVHTAYTDSHFIDIHNALGQQLYSSQVSSADKVIDISGFTAGLYFVTLRSAWGLKTEKLLIVR